MKLLKFLFVTILSLISICVYPQDSVSFKLQKDGSFVGDDNAYYVLTYPGIKKEDLYKRFYSAAIKIFSNSQDKIIAKREGLTSVNYTIPKDDIKAIENQHLAISSCSDIYEIHKFVALNAAIGYTVNIDFKDEKVKIELDGNKHYLYNGGSTPSPLAFFNESEWKESKEILSFFDLEEFVPSGNEKKDAKRLEKIKYKNADKMEQIETINNILNSKINMMLKKVSSVNAEEW